VKFPDFNNPTSGFSENETPAEKTFQVLTPWLNGPQRDLAPTNLRPLPGEGDGDRMITIKRVSLFFSPAEVGEGPWAWPLPLFPMFWFGENRPPKPPSTSGGIS